MPLKEKEKKAWFSGGVCTRLALSKRRSELSPEGGDIPTFFQEGAVVCCASHVFPC